MDKYKELQIGTRVVLSLIEDSPVYTIAWRDGQLAELVDDDKNSCGFAHLEELEDECDS